MGARNSKHKDSKSINHPRISKLNIIAKGGRNSKYLPRYKGATPKVGKTIMCGLSVRPFSDRLAASAAGFWSFIEALCVEYRADIGVFILKDMVSISDENTRQMISTYLSTPEKQEKHALKLMDMIGFVVRSISDDNTNIVSILSRLGLYHKQIGVKSEHFRILLASIHKAFEQYQPQRYTPDVKFGFEQIFKWISEKMMQEPMTDYNPSDSSYLKSFAVCLQSNVGRNHLCSFLTTQWCDEEAVFLLLLHQFKKETNSSARYLIAKRIINLCIEQEGIYVVNISHDIRNKILEKMKSKRNNKVKTNFFDEVEGDIHKSIKSNHWFKFVYFLKNARRSTPKY